MKLNRAAFVLIFALALAVRLHHVTEPPLDFHAARQYRGANIARGFYMPGNDRYPAWEQNLAKVNLYHEGLLEPPILEFITAQLYKIAGGEKLWLPRVMSILFWLAAGGLLYRLAARLTTPEAALVSLLFFLFIPYGILASRSFQPEPFMVLLLVAGLLSIQRYFENPTGGRLAAAGAVSAAALFIKPTCVFVLLTVFCMMLAQRRGLKKAMCDPALYIFTGVALLPAAAYYTWGLLFLRNLQTQAGKSFIAALYWQPEYWAGWLRNIGRTVGILPFCAALYGLRFIARGPARTFVGGTFLGYLLYGFAFDYHVYTHDYYSLQLIPIVALAIGPAGVASAQWVARNWRLPRWQVGVASGLVLLAAAVFGVAKLGLKSASPTTKETIKSANLLVGLSEKVFMFIDPGYYGFDQELADEKAIGELIHHSVKTVYLDPDFVSILYNGEISGKAWITTGEIGTEKLMKLPVLTAEERFNRDYKAGNPEYFVVSDYGEYLSQPDLVAFLQSHFPVVAAKDRRYLIYRLGPAAP